MILGGQVYVAFSRSNFEISIYTYNIYSVERLISYKKKRTSTIVIF